MDDLLRQSERATTITLKNNAALLALVSKTSIDPTVENPTWPFVRVDGANSIPQGRRCTERATVRLMVHSFAKPKYTGDIKTETARDVAGKMNAAVVEALHNHAYSVEGRRYKFTVTQSQLMQDGAEADAYHGFCNVTIKVFNNGN